MLKKNKNKNENKLSDLLSFATKILKMFYIVMIIGIIFIATILIKEWGIFSLILSILKIATPFFVGFVIAWLFNPIVLKLQDKGLNRVVSSIIVYAVFLLIIYIFFSALIPNIYKQLIEFLNSLPNITLQLSKTLSAFFSKIKNEVFDINSLKDKMLTGLQKTSSTMIEQMPNKILNSIGDIFSGLGTFSLSIIIGFYMLFDFESLKLYFVKILPNKNRYEIKTLIENIGLELRKCVNGTLFVATIVFVGSSLGFVFIGLKAPLLFGFFCGLTDIIPYIGPFIGGAVAVIVGFSSSSVTGVLALIVVLVVQQLENLVIQPLVMSRSTKIHPVTIIIGLLVFGHFFGIIGMMLATPIISVAKILYRYIILKLDWFDENDYIQTEDVIKK